MLGYTWTKLQLNYFKVTTTELPTALYYTRLTIIDQSTSCKVRVWIVCNLSLPGKDDTLQQTEAMMLNQG